MEKKTIPLWMEMKHLDEAWHSNPGCKYAKFMRMIADRIPTEQNNDFVRRNHTAQDVVEWLIDQAVKGENDVRYNYDWERKTQP
jgi:hypothetical protein